MGQKKPLALGLVTARDLLRRLKNEGGRMALMKKSLNGRKIAVLVTDGFEMAEYTIPVNALRLAGADITVISLHHGRIRGVNLHEPAHTIGVDLTIDEANPEDYDSLYVPGGFINPDLLRQSAQARQFVSDFDRAGKPIASLCHGPWVLASAGLVKGRKLTSWPGVRDDMVNAGAMWLDQSVVEDGNWLTSRGPQDFADYVPALINFYSRAKATQPSSQKSSKALNSSPQRNEPPSMAINAIKWLPRPSVRGFAVGVVAGALMAAGRQR